MKKTAGHIAYLLIIILTCWFSSCKPKHICPAYQSAFFLDQKAAAIEFTPFDKDTLPKLEHLVRKNDVLLIVRLGKKKAENRMMVIPMITIYPETDSSLIAADSLGNDSLATDDELVPEESGEAAQDSSAVDEEKTEEEQPAEAEKEEKEEQQPQEKDEAEEQPKEEKGSKKAAKKQEEKDPEISDPSLKFEFEDSFEDSIPSDEFKDDFPVDDSDVPPAPKNDDKRKAIPNQDADKPKDEEEPADDKF